MKNSTKIVSWALAMLPLIIAFAFYCANAQKSQAGYAIGPLPHSELFSVRGGGTENQKCSETDSQGRKSDSHACAKSLEIRKTCKDGTSGDPDEFIGYSDEPTYTTHINNASTQEIKTSVVNCSYTCAYDGGSEALRYAKCGTDGSCDQDENKYKSSDRCRNFTSPPEPAAPAWEQAHSFSCIDP